MVSSEIAPIDFYSPKRAELVIFACFKLVINTVSNFCKNYAEIACKKLCFNKNHCQCCSAWKNFFINVRTQIFFLNTSWGSGLSVESSEVVIRCVKLFLLQQTCAASHFQNLVLLRNCNFQVEKSQKHAIFQVLKSLFSRLCREKNICHIKKWRAL